MSVVLPIIRSSAVYFGFVFGAGFLLGMVRIPFLVPRFGERVAELAEMPLMLMVIFFAAGYVERRYRGSISAKGWILVGAIALSMLLFAEFLLAVVLVGGDLAGYIASRDPVSGSVYIAMLMLFSAMPWLRCRA